MLADPDVLTTITDQHAQGAQGMGTGLGPTHAVALLAPSGDLVVGALDKATAVA